MLTQKKILLYGNVFRDYRSQTLVKFLLDSKYYICLACPDYYYSNGNERQGIGKVLLVFQFIELFIKAAFTDIIYLPPMNTRFIKSAVLAAKLFRKKLIVEMYISIYDTYVTDQKPLKGKQIKPGTRQAKDMLKRDILALKKSDYIVHTAEHELNYWKKLLNIDFSQEKVFIAPNCNVSTLAHQKQFKHDSFLKICWWGTFIPLHGLDNILEALKLVQKQNIQFTCNLFGVDNPLFAEYANKISEKSLDSHVYLRKDLRFSDGSLPHYLINQCDLALGIFGNTDKAYNTVPNKLIEALSMGLPTLTINSPAINEFLNPETDLWTCEPSPESIAESISAIASGKAPAVDWEHTRQKVLKTFSVTRYQKVVHQVLERATNVEDTPNDLQTKADAVA